MCISDGGRVRNGGKCGPTPTTTSRPASGEDQDQSLLPTMEQAGASGSTGQGEVGSSIDHDQESKPVTS
jgi:hypothetical protein